MIYKKITHTQAITRFEDTKSRSSDHNPKCLSIYTLKMCETREWKEKDGCMTEAFTASTESYFTLLKGFGMHAHTHKTLSRLFSLPPSVIWGKTEP